MMTTTKITDPTLQLGAQGEAVKTLQELINLNVSQKQRIRVDGIFGSQTETAVKLVQYQSLLVRDGIAGPLTWQALRSPELDKPLLRRGSTGVQVRIAQTVLRDGGYYKGAIDSIFGPQMEAAVKALQVDRQLVADGILGDETWFALREVARILSVA